MKEHFLNNKEIQIKTHKYTRKRKKVEKDKNKTEREVKNGNASSVIILFSLALGDPHPSLPYEMNTGDNH